MFVDLRCERCATLLASYPVVDSLHRTHYRVKPCSECRSKTGAIKFPAKSELKKSISYAQGYIDWLIAQAGKEASPTHKQGK